MPETPWIHPGEQMLKGQGSGKVQPSCFVRLSGMVGAHVLLLAPPFTCTLQPIQ